MIKMKSTPTYQNRKWKNYYTFALKMQTSPWIVKYVQTDSIALANILINIFMVDFEQNIVATFVT